MSLASPSQETEALLARLAQRPGVQSTLILSYATGAIVRSSGLVTIEDAGDSAGTAEAQDGGLSNAAPGTISSANNRLTNDEELAGSSSHGTRRAEDVARLVFNFVKSAGDMVGELNGRTDETRLIRLRTKRNELVIVPDAKYLLVVIHDTPPA